MAGGAVIAAIPSPGSSSISIGPFELRAYGIMIALGVIAAVWLSQRRWAARGGDPALISSLAVWAVPAGLVGARLYHVVTDWRFDEGWAEPFKIWEGGLGIPGGMAAGIFAGLWYLRSQQVAMAGVLDSVAPALALAQAIGRVGNWFNQELFGRPTDLPWGLQIDPEHRPTAYADEATFHPTFLYEGLWNIGVVLLIVWLDRRRVIRRGGLIAVWLLGYGVGRLWIETVRIDYANEILGLRVNIWTSGIAIATAAVWLLLRGRAPRGPGHDVDEIEAKSTVDEAS